MTSRIVKVKRAVTRLIKAEVADSWKGGGHPHDIPGIEQELAIARKRLKEQLAALEADFIFIKGDY